MKNYRFIFMALLAGITIFSVAKYSLSLKEKYDLLNSLDQIKQQVEALELAKQNLLQNLEQEKQTQEALTQENLGLKESLKASEEKIVQFGANFADTAEQLNTQISVLKAENTALREEKGNLELDKKNLQTKLGSLAELKKAIRELKIQMRKVGRDVRKKIEGIKIIEGNRGFLLKEGKSTHPAKIRIEVKPLPQQE